MSRIIFESADEINIASLNADGIFNEIENRRGDLFILYDVDRFSETFYNSDQITEIISDLRKLVFLTNDTKLKSRILDIIRIIVSRDDIKYITFSPFD